MAKINELYITDVPEFYNSLDKKFKILFPKDKYRNRFIKTSFLSDEEEIFFNYNLFLKGFIDEAEYTLKLLERLEEISNDNPKCIKSVKISNTFYLLEGKLAVRLFFILKNLQERNYISKDTKIVFYSSPEKYNMALWNFWENVEWKLLGKKHLIIKSILNRFKYNYLSYKLKNIISKNNIKVTQTSPKILFILDNSHHKHYMLSKLYELLKASNINIYWAIDDYTLPGNNKFLDFIPQEYHNNVYFLNDFKKSYSLPNNWNCKNTYNELFSAKNFYMKLSLMQKKILIKRVLLKYTSIIKTINPDVVIYIGVSELIRNAIRLSNVPSIMIDYAYITFSTNFTFIPEFDYHFVNSEYQKKLWKKLKENSKEIIPAGYLKYDIQKIQAIKSKNILRVIGYASSHGIDKNKILKELKILIEIITKHNLKLIIKKHPLEGEWELDKLVKDNENVVVLKGYETGFLQNIDLLFSAGSSILFDAMRFSVPYIELVPDENDISHLDLFKLGKKSFLLKLPYDKIEEFINNFYNNTKFRNNIMSDLEKDKEYYLGPINPNSSQVIYDTIKILWNNSFT